LIGNANPTGALRKRHPKNVPPVWINNLSKVGFGKKILKKEENAMAKKKEKKAKKGKKDTAKKKAKKGKKKK
jgi:hypothetical protein